jgi:transcriptional regulator with XRE-family HTH domain
MKLKSIIWRNQKMARLADRMKELREEHDLTRLEMAQRLGVNKSTITRYESGDMNPTIEMLLKIRELFGVTVDWITAADTDGEDKYVPAVKQCIKEGISPEALNDIISALTKSRKG